MGAWGEEPMDNDTALDFRDDIADRVVREIKESLEDEDPNIVRAAAYFVAETAILFDIDSDTIDMAIEKLQGILEDKEWIEEWEEPPQIIKSIKKQIKDLEKLL